MDQQKFVYVTNIATTREKLWEALTSEAFTQQYWGGQRLQSDWQVGSPVQHVSEDGEEEWVGEVLQSEPPYRLSYTFQSPDFNEQRPSRVLFELEPNGSTVKLTLTHERLDAQGYMSISLRWSAILSSLLSLLETGDVLALAACK